MKNWFKLGIACGLLLFMATTYAQKVSRTTNISGGPVGQNYLADYDTNMTTLPNSATTVISTPVMINGIYCHNITGVAATVTITDNAGVVYVPGVSVAGNQVQQFLNAGSKGLVMQGLKWSSNTANAINCEMSGWN